MSSYTPLWPFLGCVTICLLITAEACYITDCPNSFYYGKRSDGLMRKCPTCGFRGTGQCFGSQMCCTPTHGCVVGENVITAPCLSEAKLPTECEYSAPACVLRDKERDSLMVPGICASDGLCCNAAGCSEDRRCSVSAKRSKFPMPSEDGTVLSAASDDIRNLRKGPADVGGYMDEEVIKRVLQQYQNLALEPSLRDEEDMYKA